MNIEKRKIIELSLRVFLAVIFCVSAYTKLISPGIIEIILVDHGFAAARETAAIYVRVLIGFELALGLLFLQPYYLRKMVIPAAFIFLIGFTLYLIFTGFVLGDLDNCGCFGETIKMSPVESIIKNIILMVLVIYLFIQIKENKKNVLAPIIILVISVVLVFMNSPIRNEKDIKFGAFTHFTGRGRVDLLAGNKLLAVFNTECDHCQETARELTAIKNKKNFPEMYVLFFTEGTVSVDSFKAITKSNFPYRMINTKEFFDLIGQTPPRIYWLNNGKIKGKWDSDFKIYIVSTFSIRE